MKLVSRALFGLVALASALVHGFIIPTPHSSCSARSSSFAGPVHEMAPFGCRVTSSLVLAESTTNNEFVDEEQKAKDPIGALLKEIRSLNMGTVINTSILLCIVLAALAKLSTVDSGLMRGWTVEEVAYRIPLDTWQSYSAILQQAPISTKAATSATVYAIGDVIAQTTDGVTIGELDRPRILRSLLAGLIGHGPLSHVWYNLSEGLFNDVLHWTEWWSFFPKVVLDQTTWGPFWNNTYILLLGLMKFESPGVIWGEMKRTTIPLLISGLKLWPLAHCITYGLIPVEDRLLWVDLVEILWVTILATAASGAAATEEAEQTP